MLKFYVIMYVIIKEKYYKRPLGGTVNKLLVTGTNNYN